jgi:hypothetical protein
VTLAKGWHPLVAEYENTQMKKSNLGIGEGRDFRGRGAVVLLPMDAPAPVKPSIYADRVSMCWTDSPHLMFDPYAGKHSVWYYRFVSAPGMKSLEFSLYGKLTEITIAGKAVKAEALGKPQRVGINRYRVTLPQVMKHCEEVTFSVKTQPGRQGTGAIAAPVKIETGEGLLKVGDWSETGALKYYSGGMIYRKTLMLDDNLSDRVMLNLGSVVATCEIKVNGQDLGVRMSPPYSVDITRCLKPGTNEIEVLVYSTLANHYQTQPTPYRGKPTAGILGPVNIEVYP